MSNNIQNLESDSDNFEITKMVILEEDKAPEDFLEGVLRTLFKMLKILTFFFIKQFEFHNTPFQDEWINPSAKKEKRSGKEPHNNISTNKINIVNNNVNINSFYKEEIEVAKEIWPELAPSPTSERSGR